MTYYSWACERVVRSFYMAFRPEGTFMLKSRVALFVTVPVLLSACASSPPFIDQMESTAIDMAVRRGAFEMNCPAATGQLISSETLQAPARPFIMIPERAEYTVGVTGCGKRNSYVVICPDNGSHTCFAGASRDDSMQ